MAAPARGIRVRRRGPTRLGPLHEPFAIGDALEQPEVARANRDYLRGLYSTIKFADARVKLTLLTGVSKFSRVSLFSGLNNLVDITLEPEYSTICGYTDADLDTVFAPELPGLDRNRIREWHNGCAWLGEEKVYNPFDVLLLFRRGRFGAWWFETGTPTFLVKTLLARRVGSTELDGMRAGGELLSAFDVDDIAPEALTSTPADYEGPRFPAPPVAAEDLFGDGVEARGRRQ